MMYDEAYTCIQLLIQITTSADHEVIFIIIGSTALGGPRLPQNTKVQELILLVMFSKSRTLI